MTPTAQRLRETRERESLLGAAVIVLTAIYGVFLTGVIALNAGWL